MFCEGFETLSFSMEQPFPITKGKQKTHTTFIHGDFGSMHTSL